MSGSDQHALTDFIYPPEECWSDVSGKQEHFSPLSLHQPWSGFHVICDFSGFPHPVSPVRIHPDAEGES